MGLYENMPFARGDTYYSAQGGATLPQIDDTSAANLVGREYIHEDYTYGTGMWVKVRVCRNDSGGYLQPCKLVRFNNYNANFGNAYPQGSSTISTATSLAPLLGLGYSSVQGYCSYGSNTVAGPEKTGVIDDLLPTGFYVPPYDLFYVVISGPCLAFPSLVIGDYSNGQGTGISVGDFLCAATGVASNATTAGTTAGTTGLAAGASLSGRFATAYFGNTSTAGISLAIGAATQGLAGIGAVALYNQFTNVVGRAISACSSAYVTAASTTSAGAGTATKGCTYQPLLIQAGWGLWE